ncbi:MAG TPA: ABC transporter substrate-binding protein, partial [Thermoplasmata archaeon]|nr:ABC transporter substrate-binding protein [Thermoplasmata archaeon]
MRSRIFAFLAVLLLTLASCGGAVSVSPSPSVTASPFPATLSDFQNRSVTVPARPERLVSIGPSITAFLFALGAGSRVVGVDDFSDEPAEAATREHVGGIKVNFEKVVALKPDLVFSVKFSDGTIEKLQAASLNVLVVDPQSVSDVAKTATLLGKAVGADGEALAR